MSTAKKKAPGRAARSRPASGGTIVRGRSTTELDKLVGSMSHEHRHLFLDIGRTLAKAGTSARGAFTARSLGAVSRMASQSSDDMIARAIEAPTDIGTLARAVAEEAAGPAVSALDPKAELLAKGAELKADLMCRAGGALSSSEAGDLLGITRQAVDKRRRRGQLIAVPIKTDHAYPRCQFDRDGVVPGLGDVLAEMPIESPWMRLEWLLTPDDALAGRSPLDALRAGDRDRVRQLARGHGA